MITRVQLELAKPLLKIEFIVEKKYNFWRAIKRRILGHNEYELLDESVLD